MAAESVERGVVLKAQDGRVVVGVKKIAHQGMYGRSTEKTTKLYADDFKRIASVGDTVLVQFSRPISRSKRWRLIKVVAKADKDEGVRDA